jgi:hypothetical protein
MSVESHKTGMPAKPGEDNWQSSTESDDHAWAAPVSAIDSSWSAPVPVPLTAALEVGAHADSTWDPGIHSAPTPAAIKEPAAPAVIDDRRATAERAATVDLEVEDIEIQSTNAPQPRPRLRNPAAGRMSTIRGPGREATVVVVPLPSPAGASGGHPAIEPRPFSARFAPRPPRRRWITLGLTAAVAGAIAFVAPRLSSQPQGIGPAATAASTAPQAAAVAPVSPSPAVAAVTASPRPATPAAAPAPPRPPAAADRNTKAAALAVTKPTASSAIAATNQRAKPALKPSPRDADHATAKPGAKAARPAHQQPAAAKLASKPAVKPAAGKATPAKTKPAATKATPAKASATKPAPP